MEIPESSYAPDKIDALTAREGHSWELVDGTPAQRSERLAHRAKQDRQAKWARVQADYPDHAELIGAFSRAFGRPASISLVTAGGEVVL